MIKFGGYGKPWGMSHISWDGFILCEGSVGHCPALGIKRGIPLYLYLPVWRRLGFRIMKTRKGWHFDVNRWRKRCPRS